MYVTQDFLKSNIGLYRDDISAIDVQISNINNMTAPLSDEMDNKRRLLRNKKSTLTQKVVRLGKKLDEMVDNNLEVMDFFKQDPEKCRYYGTLGGRVSKRGKKSKNDDEKQK